MVHTKKYHKQKIVFASSNAHKLQEVKAIVPSYTIYSPHDVGITCTPDENGTSFLENALIKAKEYYLALHNTHDDSTSRTPKENIVILSEDSGLCVEALQNRPGIYSARYGRAPESFSHPSQKDTLLDTQSPLYQCHLLLHEMEKITNRNAKFVCCAVLMWSLNNFLVSQSEWKGEIIKGPPKGNKGFGYDPIFYLPNYKCTSAELPPEEKNKLSHRKLAISRLTHVLYHFSN